MNVQARLQELGIVLPKAAAPAANYVPFVISQKQIFISGQLPMKDGKLAFQGKVGHEVTLEQAAEAAKLCAINILAQIESAIGGDWTKLVRLVKLGGFVHCGAEFTDHPKVINGASDLVVAVLGELGHHARFAVGAPQLPFGASVEIEAIAEIA
ncbi:MAG: RidA family protein [Alphaproteobacteria bacterium]